ncbi:hypothetical protein CYMTET_48489 [Cymbomonas tetramitiformis]|uniref:Sialidase domain-containing protein n=1 Tax=Cymbomonas tetramitiformis TaxID=36881 RepID=A0AAE0EV41_9CHLO|nr:hypothetical protein CYMTET_48489 [Cymbomonas tetramitiformis]
MNSPSRRRGAARRRDPIVLFGAALFCTVLFTHATTVSFFFATLSSLDVGAPTADDNPPEIHAETEIMLTTSPVPEPEPSAFLQEQALGEPCVWRPIRPQVRFKSKAANGEPSNKVILNGRAKDLHVELRWITRTSTRYAHMATLEVDVMDPKVVYAAWQASDFHEGAHDQHIRFVKSVNGGLLWEHKTRTVVQGGGVPVWGPVLHSEPGGKLWLFYSRSRHNCTIKGRDDWLAPGGDIMAVVSRDGGATFGPPRNILPLPNTDPRDDSPAPRVIANKLVEIELGKDRSSNTSGGVLWLLPFWTEARGTCGSLATDKTALLCSTDRGATWQIRGSIPRLEETWLIESTLAEVGEGEKKGLLQLFRSRSERVYSSYSSDWGRTWSPPRKTELPNPDSKVHMLRLEGGSVMVAYNNATVRGKRNNLELARSYDFGTTWQHVATLENDKAGEFSYPSIAQVPGGMVLVAYTNAVFHITHFGRQLGGADYKGVKVAILSPDSPRFRVFKGKASVGDSSMLVRLTDNACIGILRPALPSVPASPPPYPTPLPLALHACWYHAALQCIRTFTANVSELPLQKAPAADLGAALTPFEALSPGSPLATPGRLFQSSA